MNDDDVVLTGAAGADTITLDTGYDYASSSPYTLDMSSIGSIGTITLNSSGTGYTTSITSPSPYLTTNGSYSTWSTSPSTLITSNTTSSTPSITVKGDAEFEGDITVKGRKLSDVIDAIEKRLAILVPDPKKLEKYEALQKAYAHYKLLESLCEADDERNGN